MKNYELHPLGAAFSKLDEVSSKALVADINLNGVMEGTVIHEGKILDGWQRYPTRVRRLGERLFTRCWHRQERQP